ncbi:hypothetical protein [Sphaerisporangium dianthi]|uniref:Uncharacterized protein n=1 Tax=Sphaerisporangium dianthi TaxID=1436120 RepID=A0ABV9CA09_9ACTN
MSLLEKRYRYVLRLLPPSYRAEREEEMVSAFLEGAGHLAGADDARPRWSEVASVAALSLRVRLGGIGAAPRFLAWGEAVRLVAVLGLAFQSAMSCVWFGDFLERYAFFGVLPTAHQQALTAAGSPDRLWDIVHGFGALLWVAAFAALVRGRPRTAKALASLAVVSVYSDHLKMWTVDPGQAVSAMVVQTLLFAFPVLALFAGFHRDAPVARRPLWVAALPVVAGVPLYALLGLLGTKALARSIDLRVWAWVWPWMDLPGVACLALLVACVARIGVHALVPARRSPGPPMALALLVVPVTLGVLARINLDGVDAVSRTMAAVNAAQIAALLLCGVTLTVLALLTLPPSPHPQAGRSPSPS